MSIERDLARIADALEKIAGSTHTAAVAVREEKPEAKKAEVAAEPEAKKAEAAEGAETKKKAEGAVPGLDDVVAALQKYMKPNGRDAAIELLAKYGAKRASDIDEAKRADFVREAT